MDDPSGGEGGGNLVMRTFYVDASVDARLDEVAWRTKAKKSAYVRLALAFAADALEALGESASEEAIAAALDRARAAFRPAGGP